MRYVVCCVCVCIYVCDYTCNLVYACLVCSVQRCAVLDEYFAALITDIKPYSYKLN